MKAVILAAGLGTRLRPITDVVPKCMVSVNGIPIIDKQINNLLGNGINDIYVVSGYKSDILKEHLAKFKTVKVIDNPRYNETNNMYSLYLAYKYIGESDFLLMNGDVYYDSSIIKGLTNPDKARNSLIACEKGRYIEESMKISIGDDKLINHISKKISQEDSYAVSIDVYKLNQSSSKVLLSEIKEIIEENKEENSWTEVALDRIFKKVAFYPYEIAGRWYEIDNHDDLSIAKMLFEGDSLLWD